MDIGGGIIYEVEKCDLNHLNVEKVQPHKLFPNVNFKYQIENTFVKNLAKITKIRNIG